MRKFFLVLLALFMGFAGFIWYAASPSVSPKEFPSFGVVQFSEPAEKSGAPPSSEIKVVTYNIGYAWGEKNNRPVSITRSEVENNLQQMVSALKALQPDLLFLQEVDFKAARTYDINQMESLAKNLNLPYAAYVVTWNKKYLPWPYWPPQHHFGRMLSGQAILSRYPLEAQELLKFEKPKENPFWYNWFYLERIIQKVKVKIGSKEAVLWNIHLEAFKAPTRLEQAKDLAEGVAEEPNPLKIAAGDFNSVSSRREARNEDEKKELEDSGESLREFLRVTRMENAEGATPFYTMPSWDPLRKIDHIIYDPKGFRLISVGTLPGLTASDHLPVWGIFRESGVRSQ